MMELEQNLEAAEFNRIVERLYIDIANDKFICNQIGVRDYTSLPKKDRELIREVAYKMARDRAENQ